MAQQNIDFGTFPDDPSADAIRTAFSKVQNNFNQLFGTNANSTVNSINRTPGAGVTVNYPTGNVVISANIACLQVATTSLKVGRGADNTQSNVTITSSSQQLNIDIDPVQVLSNTFTAVGNNLANLNGTLTSNSFYQPNINTVGTLSGLSVSGNMTATGNASFSRNVNFTGSNVNFSNVSNLHIQGGTLGYFLQTDGAGNLAWAAGGGGGAGSPGGINTYVQFNDTGTFGGNTGFTFNKVTGVLTAPSLNITNVASIGNLVGALANGTSNVNMPVADGNVNISVNGNANVFVVTDVGANVAGNLDVDDKILANRLEVNLITGVLTTNAQPNITSVGTLTSLTTSANANINVGGEVIITNQNQHGGVGYAGMITMTNSDPSATTPNKYMRLNSTGNLQIINSAYANTIFDLSDSGALTNLSSLAVTGNANVGNLNVSNNVIVNGDLSVLGNATYINVTSLVISDPIISLGGGPNGNALTTNDGKDRGTALQYYTTAPVTAFMGWDNSNSEFGFGSNVSIASEVVTFNNYGNARANVFIGNNTSFGNANLGNTATANYFVGRFYGLSNSATIANTVVDNAQPNITSVGTLSSLAVTGNTTSGNFVGTLANGNSNIRIAADSNIGLSATGVSNVLIITSTGVNVAGTGNFTGNLYVANLLGPHSNGNSNVNIPSANGNINLTAVGNTTLVVTGTGANITGTANVSSNANVGNLGTGGLITATGNVTGGNLVTSGLISATGNITSASGVFIGNGAGLTNINASNITGAYGNSQVATFLNAYGANTITTTGNVSVGNIIGNGQALTGLVGGNVTGTVANATYAISAGSATTAGTVTTNAQPNITSVGTLTSLSVSGNITSGNISATNHTGTTSNITGQYITTLATGTAPFVVTSTTQVANLSVATAGTAGSATTAGTVTTAAQPNITSVGTLTSLGVNSTVTAVAFTANTGVFTGNGNGLSSIVGANVSGAVSFATTANAVAGANVSGAVSFATTANAVAGANVSGAVSFATTANSVAGANVSGQVSFAAIANSVAGANVSGTVSSATSATTAGTVTTAAQPNITSVGTLTSLSVSGGLTNANITTGSNVTAGTLTGNWTLTSGSRMQATYADLAEYYAGSEQIEPGTVVEFGGEHEVQICNSYMSTLVAGIVTTDPAYVMNAGINCAYPVAIALQGRIPVKVFGPVKRGDMMVSANNGHAISCQTPSMGTVLGKALVDFNGESGTIEVMVGRT